jgi:biopolymer transport protein TolR
MRLSSRAKRMITHQERNRAGVALNLIPMIDILSVMVAFLLVYSTEVETLQNTKGIEIPESVAEVKPRETVVVMITPKELLVQGEPIMTVAQVRATQGTIIEPLKAALERPTVAMPREVLERDIAGRELTIMGDKVVPYEVLKKVMATCTDANFGRISLAVLQKEKAVSVAQATSQRE